MVSRVTVVRFSQNWDSPSQTCIQSSTVGWTAYLPPLSYSNRLARPNAWCFIELHTIIIDLDAIHSKTHDLWSKSSCLLSSSVVRPQRINYPKIDEKLERYS